MKRYVIAVRDRAADTFGSPWFSAALGAAVRAFGDEINSSESVASKHPEDYDLYELGMFDDDTGMFEPCRDDKGDAVPPRMIAIGKSMVRNPNGG